MASLEAPAHPRGLHRLEAIFRAHVDRLDQGGEDRRLPAEPPLAERHRRPTGIARTVRGGSQSDAGAQTRGRLLAGRHTWQTRPGDGVAPRQAVLDHRALARHQEPCPLLVPEPPP